MTVKGHVKKRQAEWARMTRALTQTGKPNLAGWQQLAAKFGQMGWSVQPGGERFVAA